MALKKSQVYSPLWQSCDELRSGMDASQCKDYILTLLFMKDVSDKCSGNASTLIKVPKDGGSADTVALKGDKEIRAKIDLDEEERQCDRRSNGRHCPVEAQLRRIYTVVTVAGGRWRRATDWCDVQTRASSAPRRGGFETCVPTRYRGPSPTFLSVAQNTAGASQPASCWYSAGLLDVASLQGCI